MGTFWTYFLDFFGLADLAKAEVPVRQPQPVAYRHRAN
jgi:hypothetical protein